MPQQIIEFLGYNPVQTAEYVGDQLVHVRKIRGLSQKQMARQLCVDPGTLGRWERNKREPAAKYLQTISRILNS
jgi:transcriptional regulator with XRE-family HTH domain